MRKRILVLMCLLFIVGTAFAEETPLHLCFPIPEGAQLIGRPENDAFSFQIVPLTCRAMRKAAQEPSDVEAWVSESIPEYSDFAVWDIEGAESEDIAFYRFNRLFNGKTFPHACAWAQDGDMQYLLLIDMGGDLSDDEATEAYLAAARLLTREELLP